MKLTVGDLFCGAGGFADGFRQAGFEIKWAVDNWKPAVRTFQKNHPETRVIPEDILELQSRKLEPVDILIGSPPCTFFSLANRGGAGDRQAGYRFVERFLELVRDLNPRYWVMENVPQLNVSLQQKLDGEWVPLDEGGINLPVVSVLRGEDYGTPQRRRRLFSGDYPVPPRNQSERLSKSLALGRVLASFPDPCDETSEGRRWVMDPLYQRHRVSVSRLRDHLEDPGWRLTSEELDQCRQQKQAHRVYGKMEFPDQLDKPSRTITTTKSHSSRSTIVVDCPNHERTAYRTLTVRESASLQGFPVTYNFWTHSISVKARLVGNAVPPPMARAIAESILVKEGLPLPNSPMVFRAKDVPEPIRVVRNGRPRYPLKRRFRGYVLADWEPECRVELDNAGENPGIHPLSRREHLREWVTRLYLGYAKKYRCYQINDKDALLLIDHMEKAFRFGERSVQDALRSIAKEAVNAFDGSIPDASTLQEGWAGRAAIETSPFDILDQVGEIVDERLPQETWGSVEIPAAAVSDVLRPLLIEHGVLADAEPPRDVKVRTLWAAIALSIACNQLNNYTKSS